MTDQVFSCTLKITRCRETMFTTSGGKIFVKSIAHLEWVDHNNQFHRLMTTSPLDLENLGFPQVVKAMQDSTKCMKDNILFADQTDMFTHESDGLYDYGNKSQRDIELDSRMEETQG